MFVLAKINSIGASGDDSNLPLPPYNAKTGESLGPKKPGNYGRPQIKKDDGDEELALTIAEKLGIKDDPMDQIMVRTRKKEPDIELIKHIIKSSGKSKMTAEEALALVKRHLAKNNKKSKP